MVSLARTTTGTPVVGDDEGFVPLQSVAPRLDSVRATLPLAASGELPTPDDATTERVPTPHLSFGPPLSDLGKLWGIGLNYAEHAADLDENRPTEPASFMKPASAVVGPGGPIRLPPTDISDRVTAEGELAVVISRTCSNLDETEAEDVIAGYLPVIDMTAEDILERNPRYLTRAKSFDSFLVLGSTIVTPDEVDDLTNTTVRTVRNGEVVAENTVANMMTKPTELVSFHSAVMTLEPGDLISTGTPGAARIEPGDSVRAVVEDVGSVSANVV
ncbi:MAG TPA: fumarylacetoacetate hydrolase family protein [Halococcus sp.]|nr:fumarylacetoacetate hydrolase family protein [Halococcus sp.]